MTGGRKSEERHVLTLRDGEWVQVQASSAAGLEKMQVEKTITDK